MTFDQAARILDPETSREAIRDYEKPRAAKKEACRIAATALRNLQKEMDAPEECEPLTLDQLRNMYGEPARFVDLYTEYEENVIVGVPGERGVFYSALDETDLYKDTRDYGARWVAYGFKAMKGE